MCLLVDGSATLSRHGNSMVPNLRVLDLSGCSCLRTLPDSILTLTQLTHLSLCGCSSLSSSLAAWPRKITLLAGLKVLDLSECSKMAETSRLPDLSSLQQLSELGLGGWESALPQLAGMVHLQTGLRRLSLAGSSTLAAVPQAISTLVRLEELDQRDCALLQTVPEFVRSLTGLTKLDLCGCSSLATLPDTLRQLHRLDYIGLSGCVFEGRDQAVQEIRKSLARHNAGTHAALLLASGCLFWLMLRPSQTPVEQPVDSIFPLVARR